MRLRHHIAGLIERYPAATHFVVAHSHGGNIALYAAQDERVRTGLSGVACLSTPFLHARRRRLGPIAGGHLFAAVFVGFLLLLQGLMQSFGVGENAAMLWSIGISLVLAWLLARLSRSASVRMLDSIRLPDEPPTEMLIIRAMGDEASGVLTATHFLGFLISICWTRPAWMVSEVTGVIRTWGEYARRFARPAVAALVSGGAYMIIDSFYGPLLRLPTLAASAYLVAAGLSIAGAICLVVWWLGAGAGLSGWMFRFALAGMLLIPFVALVLIVALPFGPDFAVAALHLEISAEATPPGTWKVHYLRNDQPYVADVGSDDPLMHSTHHDPRAIAILAEWISSSAGRRLEWPAIGRNS